MSSSIFNPSPIAITPQLIDYDRPIRRFLLLNSMPDRCETLFTGHMMTLPARDEFHDRNCGKDEDGEPIPGSYVVSDIWTPIPGMQGEEVHTFDAAKAVAHILGIKRNANGKLSAAESRYAQSGISLLPFNPPKSMWKAVAREGERRAWLASVDNARILLEDQERKNKFRADNNLSPVYSTPELDQAQAIMKEYYGLVGEKAAVRKSAVQEDADLEELALQAEVRALAMKIAEGAAAKAKVDKVELAKQLLNDPEVLMKLRNQAITVRKRGHMTPTSAQLSAAAAENLTVADIPGQDDKKTAAATSKRKPSEVVKASPELARKDPPKKKSAPAPEPAAVEPPRQEFTDEELEEDEDQDEDQDDEDDDLDVEDVDDDEDDADADDDASDDDED